MFGGLLVIHNWILVYNVLHGLGFLLEIALLVYLLNNFLIFHLDVLDFFLNFFKLDVQRRYLLSAACMALGHGLGTGGH